MNKLIVGMIIGATCTAVVTCGSSKCLKRTKKVMMNKIENLMK